MDFGHVITAMVTPFNYDHTINYDKVEQLIDHLITNGTDAIIVGGTTGESPTLTFEEKVELFNECVNIVNNRIPVIVGTGSNNTAQSVALTKEAVSCMVDGIMLVAPYYNKPSQNGLYTHFSTIANETSLPIMIYNIPSRTGVNIQVDTVVALSNINNITSIKESSGNLEQMAHIITETDDDFYLYTGDDSNALPAMAIGATGVVSVASHVVGNEMKDMIATFLQGNVKGAANAHRSLLPLMEALFLLPNPTGVKYALAKKGVDVGEVRLPLSPIDEQTKSKIKSTLRL